MFKVITKKSSSRGFTLLEILLVVGIIAILAGIVIIAINPTKQLADARNTQRRSDVRQISDSLNQYYIDYGHYPTSTPTSLTEICDTGSNPYPSGVDCGSTLFDLSILVPTYLSAIPKDPHGTGYMFMVNSTKRVFVVAPQAEQNAIINTGAGTVMSVGSSYIASGFGDAAFDGTLTEVGTVNSHPQYRAAGGGYFTYITYLGSNNWSASMVSNPSRGTDEWYYGGTLITDSWGTGFAGSVPAGSVN